LTQLATALRGAGFGTTKERLRNIAVELLGVHNANDTATREALFARVQPHADLLCELFAPYREQALKRYLDFISDCLAEESRKQEPRPPKARTTAAPSKPSGGAGSAPSRQGFGSLIEDNRPTTARALLAKADARRAAQRQAQRNVGAVLKMSMLEEFKLNGMPIGKMTAGAALSWARRTGQHVRFVTMLAANLPQTEPIENYIKPEEANELWRRSLAEGADA
jgi:hypothetical protein